MTTISVAIVGAGQAGLAMSHALTGIGVDHLLLERGAIANSWRTERWDSLTTLTPNWANGLPGKPYDGTDPNGFMTMAELIGRFDAYADGINAPIQTETQVIGVAAKGTGYHLDTNRGPVSCRALVVATGACARARVPTLAADLPKRIIQTTPADYKRPSDLPDGPVLVVGASASGVQIARELALTGREVTLAVGNHLRLPRRYRGHDIEWWLDAIGVLDQQATEIEDLSRARRAPSPQIQGGSDAVDLNALMSLGVKIVGRLVGLRDNGALFSGGLSNAIKNADLKMMRLLDQIDAWIIANGLESFMLDPDRPALTQAPSNPSLFLKTDGVNLASIVWATGFEPDFSWLTLPVFDARGRLQHDGGVVAPGVYVLGLPILRSRRSHQISGVREDASALADHLLGHLNGQAADAA